MLRVPSLLSGPCFTFPSPNTTYIFNSICLPLRSKPKTISYKILLSFSQNFIKHFSMSTQIGSLNSCNPTSNNMGCPNQKPSLTRSYFLSFSQNFIKHFSMSTQIGSLNSCNPTSNNMGCPNNHKVSTIQNHSSSSPVVSAKSTLGRHLARRLLQIGVNDVFSVPASWGLQPHFLDLFLAEPGLNLVGCCNELNAGYAADGYARSRGVGACVVTFTVGGLSVINAIADAYSDDLPIVCIVGGLIRMIMEPTESFITPLDCQISVKN